MPESEPDFQQLLRTLSEFGVDFIVIGGISAVLQGASLMTFDLDIVHSRSPENLDRLVAALQSLDAYYREHEDQRPVPEAGLLAGPGHHLLMTGAGPLDVLGQVTGDEGYDELLPHTLQLEVSASRWIRVLKLKTLIRLKERMGRDKDKLMLDVLKRTLAEKNKGKLADD
jgi:hypothetical protein